MNDTAADASMLWQRPHPAADESGGAARITGIEIDAAEPAAHVRIDGGGQVIGIASLNAGRAGAFSGDGWNLEANIPAPAGEFWWADPGFAQFLAYTNNAARFYMVSPAAPAPPPPFLFLERFESATAAPGALDGQNGWAALPDSEASGVVQTNVVFAGAAALQVGTALYSVTPTVGDGFYVDIPLDPSGADTLIALDGSGDEAFAAAWRLLDVFEGGFAQEPLRIRSGDSLRLAGTNGVDSAFRVARASGAAWVSVTNFVSAGPVPFRFDAAVADSVATALVEVASSKFPSSNPAVVVGETRAWKCPGVSVAASLECDGALSVSASPLAGGGVTLSMRTDADRALGLGLVARLGADEPVLDAAQVITVWRDVGQYYRVLEAYPDGSQLTEVLLHLGAVPPGLSVSLEIFVAGVYFTDGTRVKRLTAADFDGYGVARLTFLRSPGITSSVCHATKIFQDGAAL